MTDREIFLNAPLDESPDAIEGYIKKACNGDEDLRKRVRKLIELDRESTDFLEVAPLRDQTRSPIDVV